MILTKYTPSDIDFTDQPIWYAPLFCEIYEFLFDETQLGFKKIYLDCSRNSGKSTFFKKLVKHIDDMDTSQTISRFYYVGASDNMNIYFQSYFRPYGIHVNTIRSGFHFFNGRNSSIITNLVMKDDNFNDDENKFGSLKNDRKTLIVSLQTPRA